MSILAATFHSRPQSLGRDIRLTPLLPEWMGRTYRYTDVRQVKGRGSGPRVVPAWMIAVAWDWLCKRGTLGQVELLNDLNVKRSAFVCALLARFSDVAVWQNRPPILERIAKP